MTVETLREKHPSFTYESFEVGQSANNLEVAFHFTLEPGIAFQPRVSIPISHDVEISSIENLAFHLGLIEAVSYWKAACSPQLVVRAGQLDTHQVRWWHDLFTHGLGEFFYRNQIDFSQTDFLSITSSPDAPAYQRAAAKPLSGDLILVGGGKDSAVTLEALQNAHTRQNVLMLNPTRAAREMAKSADYDNPIIVQRTLDPKLFALNREGYLNGHTPFSAYLAFLSVFTGLVHDYQHIIASNEQSAGEGNVVYHGLEVNHQYSKSLRFEKLFREYCAKYLHGDIGYFSFLRPLYELQIAGIFSKQSDKSPSFVSCNVKRGESWCGECPKCAFVYLSLFPFLAEDKMKEIFGQDYFAQPAIQRHIIDLVGLGVHKPFDCVGTREESEMAIALAIRKYEQNELPVPAFLLMLKDRLALTDENLGRAIETRLRTDWNTNHFLSPEYTRLLKAKLSDI